MNEELMNCDTPLEMFAVVNKYYDLDNCVPSEMIKAIFVPQLLNGIEKFFSGQQVNSGTVARVKKQRTAKNIFDAVADEYDLDFSLSPIEKQKLIPNLQKGITAIGAKQRRAYV
jgi:hypothetical protein